MNTITAASKEAPNWTGLRLIDVPRTQITVPQPWGRIRCLGAMTSAQQMATLAGANCPIAFDNLTRQLYATDASIYQIEPVAVAFPRNARQASSLAACVLAG